MVTVDLGKGNTQENGPYGVNECTGEAGGGTMAAAGNMRVQTIRIEGKRLTFNFPKSKVNGQGTTFKKMPASGKAWPKGVVSVHVRWATEEEAAPKEEAKRKRAAKKKKDSK